MAQKHPAENTAENTTRKQRASGAGGRVWTGKVRGRRWGRGRVACGVGDERIGGYEA